MKLEQAAAILGVSLDSDLETLKAAYKKLALKWHPDKCADGQAKERFQEVSVAYTRLVAGEEDTSEEDEAPPDPHRPHPHGPQPPNTAHPPPPTHRAHSSGTGKGGGRRQQGAGGGGMGPTGPAAAEAPGPEKFYDNLDEMRAFMAMFMELVGLFGNDLPPNLAHAYKGMGMPGVAFSWSSEDGAFAGGSDGSEDEYDSDEDATEEGSDEEEHDLDCDLHSEDSTPVWEPMVRHYFHMNLKEQAEHERQQRDNVGIALSPPPLPGAPGASSLPRTGSGQPLLVPHGPQRPPPPQSQPATAGASPLPCAPQTPMDIEELKKKRNQKKKADKKRRQKERKQKEAAQKAQQEMEKKKQKDFEIDEKKRLEEIKRQKQDATRAAMFSAVQNGDLDLLMRLVDEENAKLDEHENDNGKCGRSLLHACVTYRRNQEPEELRMNRAKVVRFLLTSRKPRLDCAVMDTAGCTVLHRAAEGEDTQVTEVLLKERQKDKHRKQEIDLNARCKDKGWTPLHYAAFEGCKEIVNLLLEAGARVTTTASPSAGREKGHTPLGAVKKALSDGGNKMDTQRKRKLEQVSKILAKAVSAVEELRQQREEKERLEKLAKQREEEARRLEKERLEKELLEKKQKALKEKAQREKEREKERELQLKAKQQAQEKKDAPKAGESETKKKKKRNRKKKTGDSSDASHQAASIPGAGGRPLANNAPKSSNSTTPAPAPAPAPTPTPSQPTADLNAVASRDDLIAQLMLMGFSEEACHRATQVVGFDIDALITWLCEHGSGEAGKIAGASSKSGEPSAPRLAASEWPEASAPHLGPSSLVEAPGKGMEKAPAAAAIGVQKASGTSQPTPEQRALEAQRRKEEARRINREWNKTLPQRQKRQEEERKRKERQAAAERAQREREERERKEKAAAAAQAMSHHQNLGYGTHQQQFHMGTALSSSLQKPHLERTLSESRSTGVVQQLGSPRTGTLPPQVGALPTTSPQLRATLSAPVATTLVLGHHPHPTLQSAAGGAPSQQQAQGAVLQPQPLTAAQLVAAGAQVSAPRPPGSPELVGPRPRSASSVGSPPGLRSANRQFNHQSMQALGGAGPPFTSGAGRGPPPPPAPPGMGMVPPPHPHSAAAAQAQAQAQATANLVSQQQQPPHPQHHHQQQGSSGGGSGGPPPPMALHQLPPGPGPQQHLAPRGVHGFPPPMMGPNQLGPRGPPLPPHSPGSLPLQMPGSLGVGPPGGPGQPPLPPPGLLPPPHQGPGMPVDWPQTGPLPLPQQMPSGALHDWSSVYHNLPVQNEAHSTPQQWNNTDQVRPSSQQSSQMSQGSPALLPENETPDLDAATNGELSAGARPFIPRYSPVDHPGVEPRPHGNQRPPKVPKNSTPGKLEPGSPVLESIGSNESTSPNQVPALPPGLPDSPRGLPWSLGRGGTPGSDPASVNSGGTSNDLGGMSAIWGSGANWAEALKGNDEPLSYRSNLFQQDATSFLLSAVSPSGSSGDGKSLSLDPFSAFEKSVEAPSSPNFQSLQQALSQSSNPFLETNIFSEGLGFSSLEGSQTDLGKSLLPSMMQDQVGADRSPPTSLLGQDIQLGSTFTGDPVGIDKPSFLSEIYSDSPISASQNLEDNPFDLIKTTSEMRLGNYAANKSKSSEDK